MGINAFEVLKQNKNNISKQQYKTLIGQVKSGNTDGALKGLNKILKRG